MKHTPHRRARRPSPQYQAVRAALEAARRPLRAEELWQRARRHCAKLGIATVYRALRVLAEAAQVRHLQAPHGRVYYETATAAPHDHILCAQCGHLHCLRPCRITLQHRDARVRVTGRELMLYGTCAACARRACSCTDD